MGVIEIVIELMKRGRICDNCLGRIFGNLLTGYSNKERGRIIRTFIAMLIDSKENLDVDLSNFYEIKFLNNKIEKEKKPCYLCNNFFEEKIEEITNKIIEKLKKYEFSTFLIGTRLSSELKSKEDSLLEIINPEFFESLKTEINRELGKKIEKIMNKKMSREKPEIIIIIDLERETISLEVRSLFIAGEYKKLCRGIPQATWYCQKCRGKGCENCGGHGLLYFSSIQMIIEKPILKITKGKKTKIHAGGREDIDVRCLDWRPFVIEVIKPKVRKIDLKKIEKEINKSKKIKARLIKIVENGKEIIRFLKTEKAEKTYLAKVVFEKPIDENKLRTLKNLKNIFINQRTPLRVLGRRSDKIRKKYVKKISYQIENKKTINFKIRASSGLYVKEFITGDDGRTKPSIAELLDNKPKKIILDVIKIYSNFREIIK
ncbi:MAG: tRNA pseudouridine(54/55) synthase Pus10 [Candidatus Aenigmatarchaeota archaeon]